MKRLTPKAAEREVLILQSLRATLCQFPEYAVVNVVVDSAQDRAPPTSGPYLAPLGHSGGSR